MSASEGANYAPAPMPKPVVEPGEFVFAAMHLDHGHIGGMTQGLIDAGGTLKWVYYRQPERAQAFHEKFPHVQIASSEADVLADEQVHLGPGHIGGMSQGLIDAGGTRKWVYDRQPERAQAFQEKFPQVQIASSEEAELADEQVHLVAAAAIPSDRAPLGIRVMEAGKDYFTDKTPLLTREQLAAAKEATERTGKKYAVYYSERIHVEAAVLRSEERRVGQECRDRGAP